MVKNNDDKQMIKQSFQEMMTPPKKRNANNI